MPALPRVNLLGRPTVALSDGTILRGLPKKAFVVIALILRSPRQVCRKSQLAAFLWPELPASQRANNLRQLMFRARRFEVDHTVVLFDGTEDEIRLAPGVACDLTMFSEMDRSGGRNGVEVLLDMYGGALLTGHSTNGALLRQWLADQRLQLEDQFEDLLQAAIEPLGPEERIAALYSATQVAPTSIGIRKNLMRQLIAAGLKPEARRQYREMQHIGGHGIVSPPAELLEEVEKPRLHASPRIGLPIGLAGREQAGVPHLALLPPRATAERSTELMFAEALIDDVTVALTRLRSVSVLAPHSARRIASGDDGSSSGLAKADFVLRTKITGNRGAARTPHLTLLLERAASGDLVWAETLPLGDAANPNHFSAVANGVALTLVDQIERSTLRAFQVPANAGAYGNYLLGQNALNQLELSSLRRARTSFKAALGLAPQFAPAHTGYAQSLIYEWVIRAQGGKELLARARQAAEHACELDPLFGSAHQMLGRASLFEGDFASSLEHFERAEELNPHHADLLCDFADTLMHSSFAARANQKIEHALQLNPLAPDAYWWASAGIKFFIGEYEGALSHLSRIRNSEPVLRLTAACAAMAGQPELAKLARTKFLAIDPGFKLDDWISVMPLRDPDHRRQYRHALQKAGFK